MELIRQSADRVRLDSGSPWEPRMGYSRAVAAGPWIAVSGCVGVEADGTYHPSLNRQTARCVERIRDALVPFEADLRDIIRVRIYTTCIDRWEEIAEVMGPAFEDIRPANVLVEVAKLVDGALVEIEADAWRPSV